MATAALESVSIESAYVYFGTVKFGVLKPTVMNANYITVNVQDISGNAAVRVSIQIAFKHICKALLCQSHQRKAVAFVVNRFCAGKIRETLQIATVPEATIGNSAPYFDPESARICQRYILVDIGKCSSDEMEVLKRVLHVVRESRMLMKSQNNVGSMDTNSSSADFLEQMDESEFANLIRDIGLNIEEVSQGGPSHLPSHSSSNGVSVRNSAAASSRPPSPFLHSGARRSLLSFRSHETVRSPATAVHLQSTQCYRSNAPDVITVTQHRPVNVNVVRIIPSQNSALSAISSPGVHAAVGRGTIPTSSPRNVHVNFRSPAKKESVVTHINSQIRSSKYRSNSSQPTINAAGNEPSTSHCGILPQGVKASGQSLKRIVHVIDDDDEESSASTPAKEPRLDLLLNYPRDQPNSISIHYADIEYLRPNEMLNDTIIEFYLKYIHTELIPVNRQSSIFIFNPFFYTRLTQMPTAGPSVIRTVSSRAKWIADNYKRVRTWTKSVDIFNADYIVVPIVEDIHWYLAIISFPRYAIVNNTSEAVNETDEENAVPKKLRKSRIIILDSLADATDIKRKLTAPVLKEYLVCEYEDKRKVKDGEAKRLSKERIEKLVPLPVPQQRNYTDCGLFLLKFAECFLLKPPTFLTRNDSFRRWYPNFTIRGMRRDILAKLKSKCDEESWRAYEEYSKSRDNNSQSIEAVLPERSADTRSPSPVPRRRTLSAGDNYIGFRGYTERRRSLPPGFLFSY